MDSTAIKKGATNHPPTPNFTYAYGTAGFRAQYAFSLAFDGLCQILV